MIARYTRPELAEVWSDHARFEAMREVEVAACEELDGPTPAELDAIRAATFTVEAIDEREKVTDHDTAAFVDVLSASAGPAGRWIHHGLTSSDVLDTGLALQLRRVAEIVLPDSRRLVEALAGAAREHVHTLCAGRTHGIHAEPTTFGIKLAGFAFEADRNADRLERAFAQAAVGALSGAVGTYSATSPEFEERVLARLGLAREPVSTQVVPRDRHAELLEAIALAGAGMERFATELRHLARTEVGEVREPFGRGQKGSSSMPHKRNPIKSEQIVGPRAGAARECAWRRSRTSRCGTSATSPTPRSSGSSCPTRRSCSTTCSAARWRWWRGWWSTPIGCARTSSSPTARCSPSACCSRWWSRA